MDDEVIGTYRNVSPFPSSRKRVIKCGKCGGIREEVTLTFIMGIVIRRTDDDLRKRQEEVELANAKLDEIVSSAQECSCVVHSEDRLGE